MFIMTILLSIYHTSVPYNETYKVIHKSGTLYSVYI